ncbi:hypothetical protein RAY_5 [Erwinia phage vB_EamM_RAY]|uniref:Uncharacterized protein n=1 Tax=Erwinia phage vB_EamM_RAY TaxID=1815987 RepID=A0A173GDQ6_9CAUD|nr:hypothetical protein FDH98_gp005 [Erwinia phage vB_EamM_RAY]ANH51786.2 hypothetical protein RAY_5 [Erwinia phage vB_EamM_RAY]
MFMPVLIKEATKQKTNNPQAFFKLNLFSFLINLECCMDFSFLLDQNPLSYYKNELPALVRELNRSMEDDARVSCEDALNALVHLFATPGELISLTIQRHCSIAEQKLRYTAKFINDTVATVEGPEPMDLRYVLGTAVFNAITIPIK